MPYYKYIAIDSRGNRLEGIIPATSLESAGYIIRKMGNRVIRAREVVSPAKAFKIDTFTLFPIDSRLKIVFFREVSTMIEAGISLVESLGTLKVQIRNKQFGRVIDALMQSVKSGYSLSDSLSQFPKIFPRPAISMVRAAEAGGGLGDILTQIANYMEKEELTRKKLRSATSYPKIIFGVFLLTVVSVVFFILPQFQEIFASFEAELPWPTQMVLSVTNFIKDHILTEIAILTFLFAGYKISVKKVKAVRHYFDRYLYTVPVVGPIVHGYMISRLTHTLSVLLTCGVSFLEALKIASETANNSYVETSVEDIRKHVSQGGSVAGQLARYPDLYPVMVTDMVGVGEKSGALPVMLQKVAEFHEHDFQGRIDQLSNTLQPILMVGLGVIICIILVALYLPVFHLSGVIK